MDSWVFEHGVCRVVHEDEGYERTAARLDEDISAAELRYEAAAALSAHAHRVAMATTPGPERAAALAVWQSAADRTERTRAAWLALREEIE